jgi:uncharacterized protein YndB with AHSA1/START domain
MTTRILALPLFVLLVFTLRGAHLDPVVTEGIVNAPVDSVWKAYTVKAGIESWMVAKTDIDLKIGGLWRTSYSKESNLNDDASIHHTILALDPGRMIAFRTIKTPKNFAYPAVTNTWTVVYFEPESVNKTRVTARMMGIEDDEQGQRMRAFFEVGNRQGIDALVKFFEGGVPSAVR